MRHNVNGAFGNKMKNEIDHLIQIYKVPTEEFKNLMSRIKSEFGLSSSQILWFEKYILINSSNDNWNWPTDIYVNDQLEFDLLSTPWPCICAAMLRFDVPGNAIMLAGNNARMVVAVLGLMSQGMSVNEVSQLINRHDAIDMMAIENEYYRDPKLKIEDLDNIYKKISFEEFLGYRYPEILMPDHMYDDPVTIEKMIEVFNKYKQFDHVDREEVKRIEASKYTDLIQYTWSLNLDEE